MSEKYVVPTPKSVADLLQFIFGEDIGVETGEAGDFGSQHIATFLDPEDNLVAVCASDRPFVAYSGAALSMIPPPVANEMAGGGELTEAIEANFYEVMNICSKLMMSDDSAHLRLDKVLAPGEANGALDELNGATTLGFGVDIPKYGKGGLSFKIS